MSHTQIYLVPGFFGFSGIESYSYFFRVRETLEAHLKEKYKSPDTFEIVECRTLPTSSIRRRAETLLSEVVKNDGLEADSLHFVGHSTGGLDVRMLLTPGVRLNDESRSEIKIQNKTRSALFLCCPNQGTPIANFFATIQGKHLLRLLVALSLNRPARFSVFMWSQALSALAQVDDWLGRKETFLDQLSRRVLKDVRYQSDGELWKFLAQVGEDQGALLQLTQESMDIFNASVVAHPDIRYASIAACVPKLNFLEGRSLLSGRRILTRLLFVALQQITSKEHVHYPFSSPNDKEWKILEAALGDGPISSGTNDGMVPLYSQIRGKLLSVYQADHLDVVGHFSGAGDEVLTDWLSSGAEFGEPEFQQLWKDCADFIAT